jgi:hypothetical protein
MRNKTTSILIGIVAIVLIAIFTNPPIEKHREAVKTKLNVLMQQSMYENIDKTNTSGLESNLGATLGSMLGSAILNPFIDAAITSNNYIIFSTTELTWGGETKEIGFGIFGNVILSKDIDKALKDKVNNVLNTK